MSVIAWVICGLIAGGLARRVVDAPKRGCLATIVIGVLGGLVAGALWRFGTGEDLDAFDELDIGSIVVAFVGACGLLLLLEAVGGRTPRRRGRRR